MPERELTIAAATGLSTDSIHTGLTRDDRRKIAAALSAKAREVPLLAPLDVGEHLLGAVGDSLQKPVASVLEEVWKQRKEMRDAAGKTTGDPAPSSEVELVDHTVDWAVHPSVKVTVNGASTTLTMDVVVKLKLEGAKLVIQRAHVKRFMSGKLTTSMSIKFRDTEVATPYSHTFDLPGDVTLPHGGIDLS